MPHIPNSPIAVVNVAQVVASTLALSLEAVAELTFTNARQMFGSAASDLVHA
jgi:Tat protein secretion system quality control protein TatD with DNase activity